MKIVCATHNKHKVYEYSKILNPLGFEVMSCADFNMNDEIEENGTTYEENAKIKAKYVCDKLNLPVFADDSGLEVDALNGEPGIYTARYGGEGLDDGGRRLYLLSKMKDFHKRGARMVCAICICFPNGTEYIVKQSCEGQIGHNEIGENGFGYDPIFVVNGKSFAQMTDDEKNNISHRGKATRKFVDKLREIGLEEN